MNLIRLLSLGVVCLLVVGCATPPEVKQALAAKDRAYSDNEQLMQQYRDLVASANSRYLKWHGYLKRLEMLDLAVEWATTNPEPTSGEAGAKYADIAKTVLGDKLVGLVNEIRLKKLPQRKGSDGKEVFSEGKNDSDMTRLVQRIPTLAVEIAEKADADVRSLTKQLDLSAYDDYRTNVEALRRLNAMVKRYLDIDVTVQRDDVKQLADAIKALQ